MLMAFFLLVPIFLAFAYRARGGAIPLGSTTLARILFWGLPVGIVCTAIAAAWEVPFWIGAACSITGFVSACIGHSDEQADTMLDHIAMGVIVMEMFFISIIPFYFYEIFVRHFSPPFILIVLCGSMGGIAYWLGYKIKSTFNFLGITWCVAGDASWGEFLTGTLGFGIGFTALGIMGLLR